MKILTLSIRQKHFDEIKSGVKKEEFREIRPKTEKRHVILDDEGAIVDIISYDAIRFYTGKYEGQRPSMLVKVNGALIEQIVDDNDEPIFFEENGQQHIMCDIVYQLGDIIG